MKYIPLLLLFFSIACARQTPSLPEDYVSHTIELRNDLGQLTIMLPPEMDTFDTWVNYTDYSCGHRIIHRIANSDYDLLQPSGFFYTEVPDSSYHLTISQPKELDCPKSKSGVDQGYLDMLVLEHLENNRATEFLIKEIRTINGLDFAILAYEWIKPELDLSTLSAHTFINGQLITISFQCYASDCNQFIEMMKPCLSTVEIKSPD